MRGKYDGQVPARNTDAYDWWSAGTRAEAHARDDGMPEAHRELGRLLKALSARYGAGTDPAGLLTMMLRIQAPERLRWSYRGAGRRWRRLR